MFIARAKPTFRSVRTRWHARKPSRNRSQLSLVDASSTTTMRLAGTPSFISASAARNECGTARSEPLHHRLRRPAGLGPNRGNDPDVAGAEKRRFACTGDDTLERDRAQLSHSVGHLGSQAAVAGDAKGHPESG